MTEKWREASILILYSAVCIWKNPNWFCAWLARRVESHPNPLSDRPARKRKWKGRFQVFL